MANSAIYPNAVLLGVFSAVTTILDIPPFVWHFRHGNIAASSLIFWIILLNITNFINAVIWPNANMSSRFNGIGLCDIEVKYTVASWAGLPCAIAAIVRGLAQVLDPNNVVMSPSSSQKRRNTIIDVLLVWACPIYLIIIHYIVQSNRYYIWSIAGCNPSVDNSWPSAILIFIWPCVFALVDGYYAIFLLIRLYRYRSSLRSILSAHNTTKSRFLRLLFISLLCMLGLVPLSFWILAQNLAVTHQPYSWSRVHNPQTWNTVIYIDDGGVVLYDRWIRVGAGLLIFAFFGMGQDAVGMYKKWCVVCGLGKVFPALYERHDRRRGDGVGSGPAWLSSWSEKAKGLFSSKHSSSSTSDYSDATTATTRNTKSKKGTDTSTNATLTRPSTDLDNDTDKDNDLDFDLPPSSPKSDRFFRPSSAPSHTGPIKRSITAKPNGADRPYDGMPLETITGTATGRPAAGSQGGTGAGNGAVGGVARDSVLVTREMWMEKEMV